MSDLAVERARTLLGSRFRAQGRDPKLGLDCVGVICMAFGIPGGEVRSDYRLRGSHRASLSDGLERYFRRVPPNEARAGDVLLFAPAADQLHLGIRTDLGLVHADARLGKVVERPAPSPWPVVAAYRWTASSNRKR